MAWLAISFGITNTCRGAWLNGVEQSSKTTEEHNDYCVEEGFQLARIKLDKAGEETREALYMGNCRINISDGTELELAWSKKAVHILKTSF